MRSINPPLEREGRKSSSLATLIIAITMGFAGLQVVPVLLGVHSEQEAFQTELQRIAGRATLAQWQDRAIVQRVVELGSDRDFRLRPANIRIRRTRGRPDVTIVVDYGRTQKFPLGYHHDFQFRSEVTGTSGL